MVVAIARPSEKVRCGFSLEISVSTGRLTPIVTPNALPVRFRKLAPCMTLGAAINSVGSAISAIMDAAVPRGSCASTNAASRVASYSRTISRVCSRDLLSAIASKSCGYCS
jgi:hypothetical protein